MKQYSLKFLGIVALLIMFGACLETDEFAPVFQNLHIANLIEYQTYLNNIQNGNPTTRSFSIEQAVGATESLINIAHVTPKQGVIMETVTQQFALELSQPDVWSMQLFSIALANHNLAVTQYATNEVVPTIFDIAIDSMYNNTALVSTKTAFINIGACYINKYNDGYDGNACTDAFESSEGYPIVVYANNDPNPDSFMCSESCGTIAECTILPSHAEQEIENHINANYPEPASLDGKPFIGYMQVYGDLTHFDWYIFGCNITDNEHCTCLNADQLNCFYCGLFENIDSPDGPITIPNNHHFISINMFPDLIGNSDLGDVTAAEVTYGLPIFGPGIIKYPPDDIIHVLNVNLT